MGQPGGFGHKPGGSSLVQDATRRGASDTPGKRTLVEQAPIGTGARSGTAAPPGGAAAGTEPSLHLDRDPPKQGSGPAPGAGAGALGDWVGAGKAGKVFQNATAEAFADGATNDALEIRTDWTLAEFASYELGTDAVMEVERTIHIQLARGSSILVRSRARAWSRPLPTRDPRPGRCGPAGPAAADPRTRGPGWGGGGQASVK
jgi:hypothetical protein